MNYRFILRQFGLLLGVLCACMGLAMLWSVGQWWMDDPYRGQREKMAALSLLVTLAVGLCFSCILWLMGRSSKETYFGRREAMLLVASSWLVGAAFSALPYYLWAIFDPTHPATHEFMHYVDCYFEAMSGLTTTGSTVLSNIEDLPQGLLLWRAITHWLGGLGIVVIFVAVLPQLGMGGKLLFRAEATGPTKGGLRPRIAETARVLLLIYIGLNVVEIAALKLCGLSWFDAICDSFATIATGGFSTQNASTAGYRSLAVEIVFVVFMLLAGVNFGLYFDLVKGRFRAVMCDLELRVYLVTTLLAVVLVVASLYGGWIVTARGETVPADLGAATRYGVFTVSSTRTNTGFATADVNPWGFLPTLILTVFMFTGACAGSTAGGIKLVRCIVVFKVLAAGARRAFRPHLMQPVRLGRTFVPSPLQTEALVYALLYLVVFAAGGITVHLLEPAENIDLVTAFSASIACLSNTGPGLHRVGTVQNFGWMTDASKLVLSMVMLLGRIEVFAVFALFLPSFWRSD